MADGDAQFQIGVVHGFADEPLYQWQDPFHQERYETGYTLGRWQRVTQALSRQQDRAGVAEAVREVLRRRGLG